jgi:DNA-binding transcriptional LysR family regulator
MESRKLTYLMEVIERGSLTKAAQGMGVSQPALSKMLRLLETELGVKLLERTAKGVIPTAQGSVLYRHAKAIDAEMKCAIEDLHADGAKQERWLTLGVVPSIVRGIVAPAAMRWQRDFPDVSLRIVEKFHVDLLPMLHRGELDLVIGRGDAAPLEKELQWRMLFRDHLQVVAAAHHPLVGKPSPSIAELAAFPWVFPSISTRNRTLLESFFYEANVQPPTVGIESGSVDLLTSIVVNSNYLALAPSHAIQAELLAETMAILPIQSRTLTRNLSVYYKSYRPLSRGARALIEAIETAGLCACLARPYAPVRRVSTVG